MTEFVYLGTRFYSACNIEDMYQKHDQQTDKAKAALNCMKQRLGN